MSEPIGGISVLGRFGRITPRITGQIVRPADVTQYSLGDNIGNSVTASAVVPITFSACARNVNLSGRLTGASAVVTAASGTIVLPAFDLLIFRPSTDIPFAAGSYPADNTALNVSAAAMKDLVAVFAFSASAWRNQAGGATAAGDHIYQTAQPVLSRLECPFNLQGLDSADLRGLLQAQNTWNPGAVINTIDIALDVSQD